MSEDRAHQQITYHSPSLPAQERSCSPGAASDSATAWFLRGWLGIRKLAGGTSTP